MEQVPHTDANHWPEPMGRGLLVELDFEHTVDPDSNLEMPEHKKLRTMSTATVRNVSHLLPDEVQEELLPDGEGSIGKKVLLSPAQVDTLEESTYEACGLEVPDAEENGKGELGFIAVERLIGKLKDSEHLPFTPLGSMVFFEFDYQENSNRYVGTQSGEVMERDEVGEETSEIVMPERSEASKNQLATVLGVGKNANLLDPGDRIIASRFSDSITLEDEEYPFVTSEDQIRGLIEKGAVDLNEQNE
jgi:co-chaperonin GroES (HSP10)